MKNQLLPLVAALSLIFLVSCGSNPRGPGAVVLTGPDLDLSQALSLDINHVYIKDWSEGTLPSVSVYLQNSVTGEYLVCAGPSQGLDIVVNPGVYYAKLSIPMAKVAGAVDKKVKFFKITIVANQSDPCPAEYEDGDGEIVAEKQVDFNSLYETVINFNDGSAYVTLIGRGNGNIDLPEMETSATDALTVGEISFDGAGSGGIIPNYYLMLHVTGGTVSLISPDDMPEMREGNVIYSWLDLPFTETNGVSKDAGLKKREAYIELFKYVGDDEILVGKTKADYIEDLLRYAGQKVEFEGGNGYIKIRAID